MQSIPRFALLYLAAFATLCLLPAGCGHGTSTPGAGVATSIVISPASLSLNAGQVAQIIPQLLDANGAQITNNIVFTYTATGAVQVSTNGLVCAGTWDSLTTPVVCTPGAAAGTGVVTVSSSGITQSVNAAVHARIARVTIATTPPAVCNSQKETQQYTAHAFDANGVDITSTVGTILYNSSNTASVTVDANGLATAVQPGGAFITADVNNVFSTAALFKSCQPVSIVLTPGTPVTLAVAATSQLTTTVTDEKGNPITASGLSLTYLSSQPNVATAVGGLITAVGAGSTGVVASCSPPGCNGGAIANIPVYSNLVPVTVSGSSSGTVYVTGATATFIIPIPISGTTANTAGTAIAIQQINSAQPVINSFVMSQNGASGYLGSDRGLLILTTSGNTVTAAKSQFSGKVLAISPNGAEVIYVDQSAPKTFVYNVASDSFTQLSLSGVTTAAAYSPDSLKAFLISGGQLWIYSAALAPPLIRQSPSTLTGSANGAVFLTQGSLGYVAGGAPNAITSFATCDNSLVSTVTVPVTPLKIASSYDSAHIFAVDGTNIDDVSVSGISTPAGQNCPVSVTNSAATSNFGQGAFIPDQMIVTSDGAHVFVFTPTNKLLEYVTASHATSAITLSSGTAITTGGATLDGQNLYLGATGTNDIHRISVTSGTDAQQIPVSLKDASGAAVSPDFVVVQPK